MKKTTKRPKKKTKVRNGSLVRSDSQRLLIEMLFIF